jgi:hypothetical protein
MRWGASSRSVQASRPAVDAFSTRGAAVSSACSSSGRVLAVTVTPAIFGAFPWVATRVMRYDWPSQGT